MSFLLFTKFRLSEPDHFGTKWGHLNSCHDHTWAYAWWAHRHNILFACMSVKMSCTQILTLKFVNFSCHENFLYYSIFLQYILLSIEKRNAESLFMAFHHTYRKHISNFDESYFVIGITDFHKEWFCLSLFYGVYTTRR